MWQWGAEHRLLGKASAGDLNHRASPGQPPSRLLGLSMLLSYVMAKACLDMAQHHAYQFQISRLTA